jgi:hypothetical protein
MNRIKIYIIQVTMTQEKMLLQFQLPENATVINGINISANANTAISKGGILAGGGSGDGTGGGVGVGDIISPALSANSVIGNISIAIPETGDVFFTEMVKTRNDSGSWENWLLPALHPLDTWQWNNSIGFPPLGIHLLDTTFLTAYYEDYFNKAGKPAVSYQVKVYLHYST